MTVIIASAAKINWFLHVLNKRNDGYHNLNSLMCPLTLSDSLTITPNGASTALKLQCIAPTLPNAEPLLNQPSNILYKTFNTFYQHPSQAQNTITGLDVLLHKKIPLEAGLGGGSSNAATLLLYLNAHSKTPLNLGELTELGKTIGADVPFFLHPPGWYCARGIGEQLTPVAWNTPVKAFSIILLKPLTQGISTAELFKALNRSTETMAETLPPFTAEINDIEHDLIPLINNDFLEPALTQCPSLNTGLSLLKDLGLHVGMTGTGSTLFALATTEAKTQHAYQQLQTTLNNNWWHCICTIDTYTDRVSPNNTLPQAAAL
jgi:4-diphosphocytidyl-2-C-methyl-D-erythritol kinase